MPIRLSEHAQDMMLLRGITFKEVEEAINRGSKVLQRPNKILAYYRYFCVVYKRIRNTDYVITVKPR